MNQKALFEALKTVARLVVLAVPGIVLGYLTDLPETQTTIFLTLALRFVDNYIHEDKSIQSNGLVPF